MNISSILVAGFPLWVLIASIIALIHPPSFTWFTGHLITFGLGIIMLGMGLTLSVDDFARIARYRAFSIHSLPACLRRGGERAFRTKKNNHDKK